MSDAGIAATPKAPYYAVIFTARRTAIDNSYGVTADRMRVLAQAQRGFLGLESAGDDFEITVSYWADLDAIAAWKCNVDHTVAQQRGRAEWYSKFRVRICKVEHKYGLA